MDEQEIELRLNLLESRVHDLQARVHELEKPTAGTKRALLKFMDRDARR